MNEINSNHEHEGSDKFAHDLLGLIARVNLWIARTDHAIRREEKPSFKENPKFRSFSDVIGEGIAQFQAENPETPLQYQRLEGFLTLEKFKEMLNEELTKEELDSIPYAEKLGPQLLGKTLREAIGYVTKLNLKGKLDAKGVLITVLRSLVFSKVEPQVKLKIGDAYGYVNSAGFRKMGLESIDDQNEPIYLELADLYEQTAAEAGEPQSLSLAITHLIGKYQGDLNQTWNMLANFCKYITREEERVKQAGKWMQTNMLDEFSPYQGYQDLSEKVSPHRGIFSRVAGIFSGILKISGQEHNFWADTSLINQVGKIYHAAYLLSMLEAVDVKVLSLLTAAEFVIYGPGHGPNKAMTDALVLQNLISLEKSFAKITSETESV